MPHSLVHYSPTTKPPLKSTAKVSNAPRFTALDRVVLAVSVLYPFSAFPQVIAVFNGRTEGVALLSWVAFLLCASLFFVYGIRRRVLPMIVSNSIWILMDALVIAGIVAGGSITWI
ncbi:MAG: hypothetical protein ACO1N2_01775 [Candidatus Saccharimonadota bacterium]